MLAHAAVPAACIWWKNHDASPIPPGKEDAVNSMAKFQALTVQWEAIQAFLVSGRRAKMHFMHPRGKREAKLPQLELLALGGAAIWLSLNVATSEVTIVPYWILVNVRWWALSFTPGRTAAMPKSVSGLRLGAQLTA